MTPILRYLVFCVLCAFAVDASAAPAKPNLVLFLVDDMGLMDTSVPMLTDENGPPSPEGYGVTGKPQRHPLNDWYRTPNMERLAAMGIRFSNFYAHSVCSPSRISILNGQNAARLYHDSHWERILCSRSTFGNRSSPSRVRCEHRRQRHWAS